jgi:methylated-DNA-[protein]-cysteine S-methyltransferase
MRPAWASVGCGHIEVPAVQARLWAAWTDNGLACLNWTVARASAADAFGSAHPPEGEIPEPYGSMLRGYIAGQAVDPTELPIDPAGTPFQRRVWEALRRIPRGEVRSYAAVANEIGSPRGMRAVGAANGKNPICIVVPCHRVVEAGMRLGGYTGGLHLKRFLLELEGVKVVGDAVQPGQLELM